MTISRTVGWYGRRPELTCCVFLACWVSASALAYLTRGSGPLPRPEPTLTVIVTYDSCSGIEKAVSSQEVPPTPPVTLALALALTLPLPLPVTLPLART